MSIEMLQGDNLQYISQANVMGSLVVFLKLEIIYHQFTNLQL